MADRPTIAPLVAALRRGLNETGFVEGRNVAIEHHWAHGQYDRLPALAADLVHRQVTVIATSGNASALAAKTATATIPIVFLTGADPVQAGLVASLSRPGGTGVTSLGVELGPKRLELLHSLVRAATTIAVLVNPANRSAEIQVRDMQAAARTLGLELHILQASTEREIDAAFATLTRLRAGALVISPEAFFNSGRAARRIDGAPRGAAIYTYREFAAAGGLMSYGGSITDSIVEPASTSDGFSRAAGRPAGPAVRESRADRQYEDRQGARPHRAVRAPRPRRRGDRVTVRCKCRTARQAAGLLRRPVGLREPAHGPFRIPALLVERLRVPFAALLGAKKSPP